MDVKISVCLKKFKKKGAYKVDLLKNMPLSERYRYLGCTDQLYSVKKIISDEGKSKGTSSYQVKTAGGLSYSVLADSGFDLGELSYRGIPISYLTKNGFVSPSLAESYDDSFSFYFPAGMMYTCGLMSVGECNRDGDVWHTSHGRYHNIPAEQLCAEIKDDVISLSAKVRETCFFAHALEMERHISSPVDSASITITDYLTNQTPEDVEFMLLYHFNFGYPFLSKDLKLSISDDRETVAKTNYAAENIESALSFDEPRDGCEEQVFIHKFKGKDPAVRLENRALGIGAALSFSLDTLPLMGHWKCMRSGEYVLGLEPTNSYINGRRAERENGTLPKIAPFETKKMSLTLSFFDL